MTTSRKPRPLYGRTFQSAQAAFTRFELLVVLVLASMWLCCLLPGMAEGNRRSERLHCLNNLRLIGNAFNIWSADHDGIKPFRVPDVAGGTMPSSGLKVGAAWYEFAWVSNELSSPRLLVCPSDAKVRRVARDFSRDPGKGFLHFNYRDNALSYFLNMDLGTRNFGGGATVLSEEFGQQQVMVGDRNLRVDSVGGSCSSRINNAASVRTDRGTSAWRNAAWTNGLHRFTGNLVLNDGSVQETTQENFREFMNKSDDNGSLHLLMPR